MLMAEHANQMERLENGLKRLGFCKRVYDDPEFWLDPDEERVLDKDQRLAQLLEAVDNLLDMEPE